MLRSVWPLGSSARAAIAFASPGASSSGMAVTSSPACKAVRRLPWMNAESGIRRSPPALRISSSASRVSSGGTPSAAGDALQRLPAMVARFWICTEPSSRAAAFKPSCASVLT